MGNKPSKPGGNPSSGTSTSGWKCTNNIDGREVSSSSPSALSDFDHEWRKNAVLSIQQMTTPAWTAEIQNWLPISPKIPQQASPKDLERWFKAFRGRYFGGANYSRQTGLPGSNLSTQPTFARPQTKTQYKCLISLIDPHSYQNINFELSVFFMLIKSLRALLLHKQTKPLGPSSTSHHGQQKL